MKLQVNTRRTMIDIIAEREVEAMYDWNNRDRMNEVLYGRKGLKDCSDLDLLDEIIEANKECVCTDGRIVDPQVNAMTQLQSTYTDEANRTLIQTYIDARIKEVGDNTQLCKDCSPYCKLIEQAKRELGL